MTRIGLTLCGLAFVASSARATTNIALVGFSPEFGAAIAKEVGGSYSVKSFGAASAASVVADKATLKAIDEFNPQVVLIALPTTDISGSSGLDAYEPELRSELAHLRGSGRSVSLLLSPSAPSSGFETYTAPLAAQAAREAGVALIEREGALEGREAEDFVAETLAPQTIKAHWRLVRVSSEQKDEGPATNAIDGDPDTYWHTQYDPVLAKPPHELVIDLGEEEWLVALRYLPRQDGGANGSAKGYEVYIGDSAESQPTLVAKGEFKNGRNYKTARFKSSVKARYIRFVITSEQSGGPYGSAAEIDVVRDPRKN